MACTKGSHSTLSLRSVLFLFLTFLRFYYAFEPTPDCSEQKAFAHQIRRLHCRMQVGIYRSGRNPKHETCGSKTSSRYHECYHSCHPLPYTPVRLLPAAFENAFTFMEVDGVQPHLSSSNFSRGPSSSQRNTLD